MAKNGVWQLKKLTLSYCDFGGSSRGARDFLSAVLPTFTKENPQINVVESMRRGHHPNLRAEYVNDSKRIVGVKNLTAEDILRHSIWLRGSTGRKTAHCVKKRQISNQFSVQGTWKPTTDVNSNLQWINAPRSTTGNSL